VALCLLLAAAVLAAVPLAGAALRHTADTGTFGQNQVGTLVDWGGPNWLDVSGPYTVSSAVNVSKLSAYVAGGSAVSHLRGVIYTDSGGKPGAFAAVTPVLTINANQAAGWVDLTFTSPVSLTAGSYWLGYWYADYNSRHSYLNISGSERYSPATYSATNNPPAGFPAGGTSSSSYSLYATYTTSTTSAAPVNLTAPTIDITQPNFPNYLFTASPGTWSNSPTSFSYEWCTSAWDVPPLPSCTPVATGQTWEQRWPVGAQSVAVRVIATNAAGSATAMSGGNPSFTPHELTVFSLPTIKGTPRVGSTLTVGTPGVGGLPGSPMYGETQGLRNTWLRCNTGGANCVPLLTSPPNALYWSPYVITSADVGSTIQLLVSLDTGGRPIVLPSAPTAVVTN
jgi:hypothetical protein